MIATLVLFGLSIPLPPPKPDPIRSAVSLAVPQLVAGATGHAEVVLAVFDPDATSYHGGAASDAEARMLELLGATMPPPRPAAAG